MASWGGKRPGAGRKRSEENARDPKHVRRPALSAKHPVHVVMRVGWWCDRLRNGRAYGVVRRVLLAMLDDESFRVCHLSIQHNHIHLIVEALDEKALSRGVQRFKTKAARGFNALAGVEGKVFPHRYHATQIRTARHARSAIAYVLNNWRRHREDRKSEDGLCAQLDRFASGITFDGWQGSPRWLVPDDYDPLPVAPPRTWLLSTGWREYGEIDAFERPGPLADQMR